MKRAVLALAPVLLAAVPARGQGLWERKEPHVAEGESAYVEPARQKGWGVR